MISGFRKGFWRLLMLHRIKARSSRRLALARAIAFTREEPGQAMKRDSLEVGRRFCSRQKSRVDVISGGFTSPCHNPLSVNNFLSGLDQGLRRLRMQ